MGNNLLVERIVKGDVNIEEEGFDITPQEMFEAGHAMAGNTTVTSLKINKSKLSDEHVKKFVQGGGLSDNSLERLDFSESYVLSLFVRFLCVSPCSPTMMMPCADGSGRPTYDATFAIGENDISDAGATAIGNGLPGSNLRKLFLST
jgi:hypothetical protein